MINPINDGGPAFACASNNFDSPGMSLRDWFAGQALAGLTANYQWLKNAKADSPIMHLEEIIAAASIGIADAMLAARQAKEEAP
jgi:hypothetical protein